MHNIFITLHKTIFHTSSEYAKCYLLSMCKKNHILNGAHMHKHSKNILVYTVYFDVEDDAVIIFT